MKREFFKTQRCVTQTKVEQGGGGTSGKKRRALTAFAFGQEGKV